jgi:hypothetical protein
MNDPPEVCITCNWTQIKQNQRDYTSNLRPFYGASQRDACSIGLDAGGGLDCVIRNLAGHVNITNEVVQARKEPRFLTLDRGQRINQSPACQSLLFFDLDRPEPVHSDKELWDFC